MSGPRPRPPRSRPLSPGAEPARRVLALGVAVLVTAVALDTALDGRVGTLTDLVFITSCLAVAVTVAPTGAFAVGVAPPVAMLLLTAVLAAVAPGVLGAAGAGWVQATVTGLTDHAVALGAGYALCLGTLLVRRDPPALPGAQPSKREASPAP